MGYPVRIDEIEEEQLREELNKRREIRERGLCDYCMRPPESSPCRFPERHGRTKRLDGTTTERMEEWIRSYVDRQRWASETTVKQMVRDTVNGVLDPLKKELTSLRAELKKAGKCPCRPPEVKKGKSRKS